MMVLHCLPQHKTAVVKDERGKDMYKKKKVIFAISAVLLVTAILFCVGYVNDYYRMDVRGVESFAVENPVSKQVLEDGTLVYRPEEMDTGIIFYPGGKVEHTAYEPLMKALASEGIMCVLIEMPFHLAVFDSNAAEGIQEQYPDIVKWYIGGHSLGGSMAAAYLGDHAEEYDGLILLGSYSTEDLSSASLKVLSVYGSEDKVMNAENYVENKRNLPADFTEVVLDGACHAYFGMYGAQEGDGIPRISNEEQIMLTVDAVMEFIE